MMPQDAHPGQVRLTILTPSWNRAKLLGRLAASIVEQDSALPIQWLVVDDGSTDDTAAVVAALRKEGGLAVDYVAIEHGGKHRALNAGFANARGEWIIVVDSDDRLGPGALAALVRELEAADDQNARIALFPMNRPGPGTPFVFSASGRAFPLGECHAEDAAWYSTLCFRSDTPGLRMDAFPGEFYLAESSMMYALSPELPCYLSGERIVEVEFQPDGLSAKSLEMRMASPIGAITTYRRMIDAKLPLARRVRAHLNFARFWWHAILKGRLVTWPRTSGEWAALVFGLPIAMRDYVKRARSASGRKRSGGERPGMQEIDGRALIW